MDWFNLIAIVRDIIFIFILFFEASFTGSAGTHYRSLCIGSVFGTPCEGGNGARYGGEVYFWWMLINILITIIRNVVTAFPTINWGTFDLTSFWLYLFPWIAVVQYGSFISIDYHQLGYDEDEYNFWAVLKNISTLGNNPYDPIASEAIHWALVELFAYIFIVLDFVYCFNIFIQDCKRNKLRLPSI